MGMGLELFLNEAVQETILLPTRNHGKCGLCEGGRSNSRRDGEVSVRVRLVKGPLDLRIDIPVLRLRLGRSEMSSDTGAIRSTIPTTILLSAAQLAVSAR